MNQDEFVTIAFNHLMVCIFYSFSCMSLLDLHDTWATKITKFGVGASVEHSLGDGSKADLVRVR